MEQPTDPRNDEEAALQACLLQGLDPAVHLSKARWRKRYIHKQKQKQQTAERKLRKQGAQGNDIAIHVQDWL